MKKNKEVYTGITKQELKRRLQQHNSKGKGFSELNEKYSILTRNQARAIEQYLIKNGPANAQNKINSISSESRYYDEAMAWAEQYLKARGGI